MKAQPFIQRNSYCIIIAYMQKGDLTLAADEGYLVQSKIFTSPEKVAIQRT